MTIYEFLKKDHREVSKLFKKAKKAYASDPQEAFKIFEDIKKELLAHAKAEETVFYTPLKDATQEENIDSTEDVTLEGYEEHHMIALLIKELSMLSCFDEAWGAKLNVLSEMVDHHVKEEETDIFKKARAVFTWQQARDICKEMRSLKEELMKDIDLVLDQEISEILPVETMEDINPEEIH